MVWFGLCAMRNQQNFAVLLMMMMMIIIMMKAEIQHKTAHIFDFSHPQHIRR